MQIGVEILEKWLLVFSSELILQFHSVRRSGSVV
jgi:hypothetical protein